MSLQKSLISTMMFFAVTGAVSCSPENVPGYLKPYLPEKPIVQDDVKYDPPKVDILFVVDNSGSMGTHQSNLSSNVNKFVSAFTKGSTLDYNIGIVTTDMSAYGGDCCGKLVSIRSNTRFVTPTTPNGDMILRNNFLVGTSGSATEASFAPVKEALSPANMAGYNKGFYRPDASLVVIFITDAEDQSYNVDALDLYDYLLKLKNGEKERVLAYGAIIPRNDPWNCTRDGWGAQVRLEDFLSMVVNSGTNTMNLCDPSFGTQLANIGKDIAARVGSIIYLKLPPDVESIRVTYGAMTLPRDFDYGWTFDSFKNAIILGSKIDWNSQPVGTKLKVYYNAAKIEE